MFCKRKLIQYADGHCSNVCKYGNCISNFMSLTCSLQTVTAQQMHFFFFHSLVMRQSQICLKSESVWTVFFANISLLIGIVTTVKHPLWPYSSVQASMYILVGKGSLTFWQIHRAVLQAFVRGVYLVLMWRMLWVGVCGGWWVLKGIHQEFGLSCSEPVQ